MRLTRRNCWKSEYLTNLNDISMSLDGMYITRRFGIHIRLNKLRDHIYFRFVSSIIDKTKSSLIKSLHWNFATFPHFFLITNKKKFCRSGLNYIIVKTVLSEQNPLSGILPRNNPSVVYLVQNGLWLTCPSIYRTFIQNQLFFYFPKPLCICLIARRLQL